jgi:membrane-associated phospholipid phosphatase
MPATFHSKFIIWNGMLIWLGLFYYGPQWWPLKAPYELTPSSLDQAIPFIPQTAWIYQSLFFLLPLATFVQPDRNSLLRFTGGFCLLVLTFATIFWVFPTELLVPLPDEGLSWGYDHLVRAVDGRRNAFPSLHASLTTFAGTSMILVFRKSRLVLVLTALWTTALLISTLTTKQHIFLDLLASAMTGLAAILTATYFGTYLKPGSMLPKE